jgi:hypothetical protein
MRPFFYFLNCKSPRGIVLTEVNPISKKKLFIEKIQFDETLSLITTKVQTKPLL